MYELELAGLEDTQAISEEIRKRIQAQIEKRHSGMMRIKDGELLETVICHPTNFIRMELLRFIR